MPYIAGEVLVVGSVSSIGGTGTLTFPAVHIHRGDELVVLLCSWDEGGIGGPQHTAHFGGLDTGSSGGFSMDAGSGLVEVYRQSLGGTPLRTPPNVSGVFTVAMTPLGTPATHRLGILVRVTGQPVDFIDGLQTTSATYPDAIVNADTPKGSDLYLMGLGEINAASSVNYADTTFSGATPPTTIASEFISTCKLQVMTLTTAPDAGYSFTASNVAYPYEHNGHVAGWIRS